MMAKARQISRQASQQGSMQTAQQGSQHAPQQISGQESCGCLYIVAALMFFLVTAVNVSVKGLVGTQAGSSAGTGAGTNTSSSTGSRLDTNSLFNWLF